MQRPLENLNRTAARLGDFFFGFDGRVSRSQFWFGTLLLWLSFPLITAIVYYSRFLLGALGSAIFLLAGIAFVVLGAWGSLALAAKRSHDRDKSAFWLLLFCGVPGLCQWAAGAFTGSGIGFVGGVLHAGFRWKLLLPGVNFALADNALIILSAVVGIWGFVELGLRRGIVGGNLYGDDPIER